MLRVIRGARATRPAGGAGVGRLRTWARSLRARHRWGRERWPSLALTHARLPGGRNARRSIRAWTFVGQITVVLQAFLSIRGSTSTARRGPVRGPAAAAPDRDFTSTREDRGAASQAGLTAQLSQVGTRFRPQWGEGESRHDGQKRLDLGRRGALLPRIRSFPLAQEAAGASRPVVGERRRHEESVHRPLVFKRLSASVEAVDGGDGGTVQSWQRQRSGIRERSLAISASDIDIQALTDQVVRQIDLRVVAWRERMGQVF